MNSVYQIEVVDDAEKLKNLRTALTQFDLVAVDTEFHAENRYFPDLMLLQISAPNGKTWLVDPLKVSVAPLGPAMRKQLIITHGGHEDLRILYRFLGLTPKKFFDTQLAAAFIGMNYPMRFSILVKEILSIEVDKSATLSDWSRRPLGESQKKYAAEDASLLLLLHHHLNEKLESSGNMKSFEHACEEMKEKAINPTAKETDWLNWNVAESLSPTSQRVLTHLLGWREEVALEKNKPANYILPKSIALDLARRCPKSHRQLYANRRIHRGLVKRHGDEILNCVADGVQSSREYKVPNFEDRCLARIIRSWVTAESLRLNIHPELLMPLPLSLRLSTEGLSVLTGWRKELLHANLSSFLAGETVIFVDNGKPKIVPKSG